MATNWRKAAQIGAPSDDNLTEKGEDELMTEGLTATFRIVTPMFLGSANQKTPELRPPAIKGALRFWWRAMRWGPCWREAGGDERAALRLLHQREAEIFGVASGDRGGRQSTFRLRARTEGKLKTGHPPEPMTGQKYLLGQGLFRDGYSRDAVLADQSFKVYLTFRREVSDEARRQVEQALMLLGLLGGLGSRARKGFGSIVIDALEGSSLRIPTDVPAFEELLSELVPERAPGLPPFTAFSNESSIHCSRQGKDPWQLLDDVGFEMLSYRTHGLGGVVEMHRGDPRCKANPPAEQNFPDDHANALKAATGTCPEDLPRRIVFGLPHNYHFSSIPRPNNNASFEPDGPAKTKRRASPLLVHVHRFPDGTCAAIQSFLPARFLPDGLGVRVTSRALRGRCVRPFNPSWKVVRDYLDRFGDRKELLR